MDRPTARYNPKGSKKTEPPNVTALDPTMEDPAQDELVLIRELKVLIESKRTELEELSACIRLVDEKLNILLGLRGRPDSAIFTIATTDDPTKVEHKGWEETAAVLGIKAAYLRKRISLGRGRFALSRGSEEARVIYVVERVK